MKDNEVLYQTKKFDYITKLCILTVIVTICFLSVGFSSFTASNRIEGILATVEPQASVKVTNIMLSNTTNGGVSNSEEYNVHNIYGNIELPNANSTVTYKVNVTVFLAAEMKLSDITGLDSNLEYSLSDYTLGDTLCNSNNVCNYGATDEMYITIGYKSGGYNSSNTSFPYNLNFVFEQVDHTAKVGNIYYETLQQAINAVPTNGTETTVQLLKDVSEVITVNTGQNITLNLNSHTLSNNGVSPVITNTGTIRMSNGTITSSTTQGAVNNNTGGTFIMTGGSIIATGTKQAIYNDGGTLSISGNAYLKNNAGDRPSVHNLNGGTLTITGGKIESTRYRGVENHATLTIGVKDGTPSTTSPEIIGKTHGVFSDKSFVFYDGIVKGSTAAFNNESLITEIETGYTLVHGAENIGGVNYAIAINGIPITITFNPNGGTVSESTRALYSGGAIGPLPTPTRSKYVFDGWFDAATGGNEITSSTTFDSDDEIFAHWSQPTIAKIGNTSYVSIQDAVNAVPNNTQTTIVVEADVALDAAITINSGKKITFDLNNHTLTNRAANINIFENKGTSTIENGTVRSNASSGAINNRVNTGHLTISNLTVIATGTRQALYNEYGTTIITGNSFLSNTTNERPAVQNKTNGTLTIISATIESSGASAVGSDSGTLTIGDKDGNISTTSPVIKGEIYGVESTSTFNYYDGVIKGKTDAISGTIDDQEGTLINGVDGSYITAHLE